MEMLDIMFRTEEKFGVVLTNEEVEPLETVHDLFALLIDRGVIGNVQSPAPSTQVFRVLCDAIRDLTADPGRPLTKATPVRRAIRPFSPKAAWPELEKRTGWVMPALRRPRWLSGALVIGAFGLAVWGTGPLRCHAGAGVLAIVIAIGLTAVFVRTGFHATRWARRVANDKHLGPWSARVHLKNAEAIAAVYGGMTEEQGWALLVDILIDALGVDKDDITAESRLVEDLGIG